MCHRVLCALLVLCICVPAGRAHGQELTEPNKQRALPLIKEAQSAYERGNHRRAEALLLEAYGIYPSDKIQYSLGLACEGQRKWLQAADAFSRFLWGIPEAERRPGQTQEVTDAMARLATHLGRVQAPAGQRFRIDDAEQVSGAAGPVFVEPGSHRIRFADGTVELTVQAGEQVEVAPPAPAPAPVLAVTAPLPAASAPALRAGPPGRPGGPLRVSKWVLLGVGAAAVIAGGALWGLDGQSTCARPAGHPYCPQVLNTQIGGIALVAGGAAALGVAGVLFGLDLRRSHERTTMAMLTLTEAF